MLPALTLRRRVPLRRALLGAGSVVLTVASIASAATVPEETRAAESVADALRPSSWAMTLPSAWLAAPVPRLRSGDQLDILLVRPGERAYAAPVAYGVSVISSDESGLVLEVDEADAIAIGSARGAGFLLVPLLRSTR